jgi:hypothetical protein
MGAIEAFPGGGATLAQLLSLASLALGRGSGGSGGPGGGGDAKKREAVLVSVLEELQLAGFIYCTGAGAYTPL